MSHCDTLIRYENVTLWHFGRPPDTNFMPHCDMQIRYEMSQCHTFQPRKNVFSYEMCDIVTSVTPHLNVTLSLSKGHPEPVEGPRPIIHGCTMSHQPSEHIHA